MIRPQTPSSRGSDFMRGARQRMSSAGASMLVAITSRRSFGEYCSKDCDVSIAALLISTSTGGNPAHSASIASTSRRSNGRRSQFGPSSSKPVKLRPSAITRTCGCA